MMREQLKAIREEAIKQIQDSGNLDKLNDVRVAFLGKKGQLTAVLKGMKDVAQEERRDEVHRLAISTLHYANTISTCLQRSS